ncbi:MAG: transglycosylase domain-containing protein [Defluviitaleaceae bacterium]|nr:transglycosylase domain-containing protein [Defluviitaleaceae bacterium]
MQNNYSKHSNKKSRKKNSSANVKMQNKILVISLRVLVAFVLIFGFTVVGGAIGVYVGIIRNAPHVFVDGAVITSEVRQSIIFCSRTGEELVRLQGDENREFAPLDMIPLNLQNAFIAIEDERFFTHNGVDIRGMFRALRNNLSDGDRIEGASTITQQVIKNALRIPRNTFETKLQEQYLSIRFEQELTELLGSKRAAKEYVLEVYLNIVPLHHNIIGVRAAAHYYFNKCVSELTLSESAVLAGITNRPSFYDPIRNPDNNARRMELILDSMLRLEMITEWEHAEALRDNVFERIQQNERVTEARTSFHPYYIDEVIRHVQRDLQEVHNLTSAQASNMLFNGGLRIYIPWDREIQAIVDEVYNDDSFFPAHLFEIDVQHYLSVRNSITGREEHHRRISTVRNMEEADAFVLQVRNELVGANDDIIGERIFTIPQPQSGMVIMDFHTGEVKAIAGGRGEKIADLTFNRATDARRQPGSVFKVLASFAPSLDLGHITPGTIIDDAPTTFLGFGAPYTPRNWDDRFRGYTTVRDAIVRSMNVMTVQNLMNTGIDPSFNYLLNFGFTTLHSRTEMGGRIVSDRVPSLALGGLTEGVTQLELTAAFAAIANGGEYLRPKFYNRVLDHTGEIILENIPEPITVISPQTAYLLTNMMTDVMTSPIGTGGRARFREVRMPISGKTGTTSDSRDVMFSGFTPYFAASIHLGFDQPKAVRNWDGAHLVIWRTIMERIHEGLPERRFEAPPGIVRVSICLKSGMLPVPGLCDSDPRGSQIRSEVFAAGTQPQASCHVHVRVDICTASNMEASVFCPPHLLTTAVRMTKASGADDRTEDRAFVATGHVCNVHDIHSQGNLITDSDIDINIPGADHEYYVDEFGQLRRRPAQSPPTYILNQDLPQQQPSLPPPVYVPEYIPQRPPDNLPDTPQQEHYPDREAVISDPW